MADFDSIIRPYQSVKVTPAQRVIATGETDAANVVLMFGKGGSPKSLAASYSYALTTYMDKQQKETGLSSDELPGSNSDVPSGGSDDNPPEPTSQFNV
jgi:hypothetical protein